MADDVEAIIADRWQLGRRLGEGGFATVFEATDATSGERVAIKLLRQEAEGGYPADTIRRFDREAAALAQLQSEHTIQMRGFGTTADGTLYLVFEHIDGVDLAELLRRRGKLASHEIVHILTQLLHALDEAHRHGVLHRDLKPHNVLIYERDGDPLGVKLIDFGIARSLDPHAPSMTQTGVLVGTPRYMSPEQLRGQPLTAASDIYSLGLIAYEMALGADALPESALGAQVDRVLSDEVLKSPELDQLGGGLHQVITRMSARHAEDRYQTAHAVLVALDREPKSTIVRASRTQPSRQHLVLGLLAGLAIVAIAAMLINAESREPARVVVLPVAPPAAPPKPPPSTSPPVVLVTPEWHSSGCFAGRQVTPAPNVRLPSNRGETPLPLVVLFHDAGVGHLDFLQDSGFAALADRAGIAVLSLEGKHTEKASWNPWGRPDGSPFKTDPFIAVFETVIKTLDRHCIDQRQVIAVGHGLGAEAARFAACRELFTGLATVSSVGPHPHAVCEHHAVRKIRRISFNPANSRRDPVFAHTTCPDLHVGASLNETDDSVASTLRCETNDAAFSERVRDRQRRTWTCDGFAMESHLIPGGHNWPGVVRHVDADRDGCDGEPPEIDYASEIWEFFERHAPSVGERPEDEVDDE